MDKRSEDSNGKSYFEAPIIGIDTLKLISQGAEAVSSSASNILSYLECKRE